MPSKPTVDQFQHTQHAELESWFSHDPKIERDKRIREIVRYPLLKKQMGLDHLDTRWMQVWDIGAGPFGGVSTIIDCARVERFDPLGAEYAKHYPLYNYHSDKAEQISLSEPDLIIITNALDHFEHPRTFLGKLGREMKPGSFFSHIHAINNAYTHPHEAHAHNVNPEMFKDFLSKDFELVWYLDYEKDGLTYGWRKQPAFSGLYRKVTGY